MRAGVRVMVIFGTALVGATGCRQGGAPPAAPPLAARLAPRAVPPAPPEPAPLPADGIRAIYLTGWSAGSAAKRNSLIGLVDRTTLNAMVIDVKDDGDVTYRADVPQAKESVRRMPGHMKMIRNIDDVIATLQKHGIFPIARIACFRDTPFGATHPALAVHNRHGGVWHDKKGHIWLNPYKKENWDYNVDLALDALKHGFKEIQFDYVRFPTDGRMSEMTFPDQPKDSKHEDQIAAFLKYAHDKIHAHGGWFSADVFGLTSMVDDDEGIGQKFVKVVENIDYLCPMVYPSHYAHGEYRLKNPNAEPYKLVTYSVGDAKKRLKTVKTSCKLRPWIQDFSLGAPRYGPAQVKAEIKALKDLGITEYCLWNAGNHFTEAAFEKDPNGAAIAARAKAASQPAGPGAAPPHAPGSAGASAAPLQTPPNAEGLGHASAPGGSAAQAAKAPPAASPSASGAPSDVSRPARSGGSPGLAGGANGAQSPASAPKPR